MVKTIKIFPPIGIARLGSSPDGYFIGPERPDEVADPPGFRDASVGANLSAGDFADHDGWYDDVSDGLISASVKLKDGTTPAISAAWLIVAPPKYAPNRVKQFLCTP